MPVCVTPEQLASKEIIFHNISVAEQRWEPNACFSYLNQPRPNTGIFILCSDLTAFFCTPNREPVVAKKGSVILAPKGLHYKVVVQGENFSNAAHSYVINFDPFEPDGSPISLGSELFLLCTNFPTDLLPLSDLYLARHSIPSKPLKVQSLFFATLEKIFDRIQYKDAHYYPIRHGVALLQKEWRQNYKLARYAHACNISETHFRTLFKAWIGLSPVEFRNSMRLSFACSLLADSACSIEEIANQVGFEDSFYFARFFKKQKGCSPREYRRRVQNTSILLPL